MRHMKYLREQQKDKVIEADNLMVSHISTSNQPLSLHLSSSVFRSASTKPAEIHDTTLLPKSTL